MASYSDGFRARIVGKLVGPNAVSMASVWRETGISRTTLSTWVQNARHAEAMAKREAKAPRAALSAKERLRIVAAAEGLEGDALGALLRREGVHESELQSWRQAAEVALSDAAAAPRERPPPGASRRIRELERELKRKDKALAEAAAILVLRKKMEALWGDADSGTDEENDK